jgi:beta-N-acetylhexosaminidase
MTPSDLSSFGDFLIIGLHGTSLTEYERRMLETIRPAGVLLLGRNFRHGAPYGKWMSELRDLLSELRKRTGRERMFITLDHEGGHVVRPPAPITRFPYPSLYREKARKVAKATAVEIKSLGVNVSWAPSTDIHSNPSNPVIGPRAFGQSADEVEKFAIAYYKGLTESGVVGCAKHFPGHGDTSVDSHLELPMVDKTLEELKENELRPFRKMLKLGVPFVMTSHILFPRIDPLYPASISPTILRGILREKWKYDGVVVSDDLEMKAIAEKFNERGTLAKAFYAGLDMFCMARHPTGEDRAEKFAQDFVNSLNNGSLPEELVSESRRRVQNLLQTVPMYDVTELDKKVFKSNHSLSVELTFNG